MVKGEHLRPLLGFAVVCVTAALIMGSGLNPTTVVGIAAAPQARNVPNTPDLVLGETLDGGTSSDHGSTGSAAAPGTSTPPAATQRTSVVLASLSVPVAAEAAPGPAASSTPVHAAKPRRHRAHHAAHHQAPAAATKPAPAAPAPVPAPAPAPGSQPATSPAPGHGSGHGVGHGSGHGASHGASHGVGHGSVSTSRPARGQGVVDASVGHLVQHGVDTREHGSRSRGHTHSQGDHAGRGDGPSGRGHEHSHGSASGHGHDSHPGYGGSSHDRHR